MQRSQSDTHHERSAGRGSTVVLTAGMTLFLSIALLAQDRPPLQEPIALEGTMKQFYRAANVVIVTTMDGVEHVYHFTKDLIVHGGKKSGVDALEGLREGTTVVIHEAASGAGAAAEEIDVLGDEGLKIAEGMVTRIDRRRKELTIRYNNGQTETLQMTGRAAAEGEAGIDQSGEETTRIIVSYTDDAGRKVAHYFKKAS
jgi:hypothetical protein